MNATEIIRGLDAKLPSATFDPSWLPEDPAKAFLVCLGAGPWKIQRRVIVQTNALVWYAMQKASGHHDLADCITLTARTVFPLAWQNAMLVSMIENCRKRYGSFSCAVGCWQTSPDGDLSLVEFFEMAGRQKAEPTAGKCLWIYARDFLGLPAFPIDRHVARQLQASGLPVDSWRMVQLCQDAGVDPSDLARRMFSVGANNPDWSKS
jgi:hypothetical protein